MSALSADAACEVITAHFGVEMSIGKVSLKGVVAMDGVVVGADSQIRRPCHRVALVSKSAAVVCVAILSTIGTVVARDRAEPDGNFYGTESAAMALCDFFHGWHDGGGVTRDERKKSPDNAGLEGA